MAELAPHARDELKLLVYEARSGIPVEALAAETKRLAARRRSIFRAPSATRRVWARAPGSSARRCGCRTRPGCVELFVEDHGEAEGLALAEAMNRRAPLAIRANTARVTREALIDRLAEENVTARADRAGAGRPGLRDARERLRAVGVPRRPVRGDGRGEPAGRRAGGAAARRPRGRRLRRRGRQDAGHRRRAGRQGAPAGARHRRQEAGGAAPPRAPRRPHQRRGARDQKRGRSEIKGQFDRVLVDAPCSGLGTLRRNPEARWRLTRATVDSFPARQLALLVTYAPLVAVGGRLIYATCTVARAENEKVVERFLAERDDFVPVPVKEIWGRERARAPRRRHDAAPFAEPSRHRRLLRGGPAPGPVIA